jgi:hypothetical protein
VDNGDGTCSLKAVVETGGGTQPVNLAQVGGAAIALGAAPAAASLPVVPAIRTPVSSDVSVPATSGGTTLAAAASGGQFVTVSNNGLTPIWLDYGGTAPVADTAIATGIGRGIMLASGGLWESPTPITTAVKGIAQSGQTCSARVTVS